MKKEPSPTDLLVGSRIRMRRIMLNISQAHLGDQAGVTFQQIQKYETGQNRVCAGRLQQIADILQVPIAFFFETNLAHPKDGFASPTLDKYETALVMYFRSLNQDKKKLILALINAAVMYQNKQKNKKT